MVKIGRIEKNIETIKGNIRNKVNRKTFNKFTTDFLEKGIVKSNVVQIPKKDTSKPIDTSKIAVKKPGAKTNCSKCKKSFKVI